MNAVAAGPSPGLAPILVVEDNPDDELLLREAFRRTAVAHPLVFARDGLEALAHALPGARSLHPVLILLDLKLPHLSGFEVLARLRAEPATMLTPIVVLSSSAELADVVRSYEAGANSYLEKPLEFAALIELVVRVTNYWLRYNEPPPALPAQA